jgi:hypothetical protein
LKLWLVYREGDGYEESDELYAACTALAKAKAIHARCLSFEKYRAESIEICEVETDTFYIGEMPRSGGDTYTNIGNLLGGLRKEHVAYTVAEV